jgi:hypothetical protein
MIDEHISCQSIDHDWGAAAAVSYVLRSSSAVKPPAKCALSPSDESNQVLRMHLGGKSWRPSATLACRGWSKPLRVPVVVFWLIVKELMSKKDCSHKFDTQSSWITDCAVAPNISETDKNPPDKRFPASR